MKVYTGAQLHIHGILDEKIDVSFNNFDGPIGLVFHDNGRATGATLSYAAAVQMIDVLTTALEMRQKANKRCTTEIL